MTIANPEQFNAALMEALGLKPSENVVSITITAKSNKWPSVIIERHVSVTQEGELVNWLEHLQLKPKDDAL